MATFYSTVWQSGDAGDGRKMYQPGYLQLDQITHVERLTLESPSVAPGLAPCIPAARVHLTCGQVIGLEGGEAVRLFWALELLGPRLPDIATAP